MPAARPAACSQPRRRQTGSRWPPPHLIPPAGAADRGAAAADWLRELAGLYAGVAGSLAAHAPASAVFFAVYETAKVAALFPLNCGYIIIYL